MTATASYVGLVEIVTGIVSIERSGCTAANFLLVRAEPSSKVIFDGMHDTIKWHGAVLQQ